MFIKEILVDTDGQLNLVFSNTIKQFIFYLNIQISLTNTIQLCNLSMQAKWGSTNEKFRELF